MQQPVAESDYVTEFAKKLLRYFPIYQPPRNGRGYRRLQFDGDVIERAANTDHMISLIQTALPSDVTISAFLGSVLHMYVCQDGAIRDAYDVFLASAEWQGPEEGGIIPQIQVLFEDRRDDTGRSTGTIVKEVRDVTDFILLRDRIEKLHLEEGDVIVVGSQQLAREIECAEPTPGSVSCNIIVAPEGDISKMSRSAAVDALVALIDERVQDRNTLELDGTRYMQGGDYEIALTKIRKFELHVRDASCCNTMDWTEKGIDMTQEHHPRCSSFGKK